MTPIITHTGWRWEEVRHLEPWKIPDAYVMQATLSLKLDHETIVYDLGCGIGRHTVYLAQQGLTVYGSDISEKAIEMTHTWLEKIQLSATLQQGHFLDVTYPDNFFDMVVSINTINHGVKSEVWKIIQKVQKMLKPGGIFVGTLRIKDPDTPFYSDKLEIIDDQTMMFKEGEERGIPHYYTYLQDIPAMFQGYTFVDHSFILTSQYKPPFTAEHFTTQMPSENLRFYVQKSM